SPLSFWNPLVGVESPGNLSVPVRRFEPAGTRHGIPRHVPGMSHPSDARVGPVADLSRVLCAVEAQGEPAGGGCRPTAGNEKEKEEAKEGPLGAKFPVDGGHGGGSHCPGGGDLIAVLGIQDYRRPAPGSGQAANSANAPGQSPVVAAGPSWTAKADPPKGNIHPKDDLSIKLVGEPLFASGRGPFVADLVPVIVGTDKPPVISVYDLRPGERPATAKAIQHAQSPKAPGGSFVVALGPEGKTLAALVKTTTGKGRQSSTTSKAVVYRLGQDTPIAEFPV